MASSCIVCEEDSASATWILVQWVGSYPETAYDIINQSDVVFDEYNIPENLSLGDTIMVRCGKIKSPANVLQVSESTDELYAELGLLKRKVLGEKSLNVMAQVSINSKKRRLDSPSSRIKIKTKDAYTQTDEDTVNLLEENRKLKAELYESNKIFNAMCKELSTVMQNSQKKLLNIGYTGQEPCTSNTSHKEPPASQLSPPLDACPVIEQNETVLIGTGQTPIPRFIFNTVNWLSFTHATRKLLMSVFPRNILATHSLTGKPSPAFMSLDMPTKMRLDPRRVADIVEVVSTKCGVSESMVRSAITTKCADENKMFKKRLEKKKERV